MLSTSTTGSNIILRINIPEMVVIMLLLSLTIANWLQRVQSFTFSTRDSFSYQPQGSCLRRIICDEKHTDKYESISYTKCTSTWTSPKKLSTIGSSAMLFARLRRQRDGDCDNKIGSNNTNNNKSSSNKNADENTTIIPGYDFFRRGRRRSGDDDNTASTKRSAYVPSGMSRAEYAALRKTETKRKQEMNHGSLGPRFRRTDRPDGDWMTMTNLWMFGQIGNSSKDNKELHNKQHDDGGNDNGNGIRPSLTSLRRCIQLLVRNYGPSFLLGYVLVDCLYSGYAVWKFKQIRDLDILRKAHGLAYVTYRLLRSFFVVVAGSLRLAPTAQQMINPTMMKIATTTVASAMVTAIKVHALKIAVAILQTPLWNILMERANRRWLWSKRRFVVTVASVATIGLAIFGIALLR